MRTAQTPAGAWREALCFDNNNAAESACYPGCVVQLAAYNARTYLMYAMSLVKNASRSKFMDFYLKETKR
jgi:hypothetical protein